MAIGGFIVSLASPFFAASVGWALVTFASFLTFTLIASLCIDVQPTSGEQRDYDRNTEKERVEVDSWHRTFACSACGHRFIPPDAEEVGEQRKPNT